MEAVKELTRIGVLLLSVATSVFASDGKANVLLFNAGATLTQVSDTSWTLTKTGTVDPSTSSVTWTIDAIQGTTTDGHLVANGFIAVVNFGTGGATIGNIVTNLQTLSGGRWVTLVSDIADATHGDAATSARVVPSASSENRCLFTDGAASGKLSFTDANTNTLFSLVPPVTLPPLKIVPLLYSASFDNKVLKLADGTRARIEVIVTFGNHPVGDPNLSDTNVDMNGNGKIDADEAKVRSVSTRTEKLIPLTQAANTSVTLSDAASDLAATGTVAFSNPVFTLGLQTETATVHYSVGATGGTITNCAHAKGSGITAKLGVFTFPIVDAFYGDACSTQAIQAPACTPGTVGCGWKTGDMSTNSQGDWGNDTGTGGTLLVANYLSVYASTAGTIEIGVDPGGFAAIFTTSQHVLDFLPQGAVPGAFNSTLVDPLSTSAGVFGGDVMALKLNIDYSDAGVLHGTAGLHFGDLHICGLATPVAFNALTVRQFLDLAHTALGGGATANSILDLDIVADDLNAAFDGGVNTFAQQHLVNGACQ